MAYNNDNSEQKLKFLNRILANTEKFTKICGTDGFEEQYPFKEEEWKHGFNGITTELNDQIVLLFIGPFSSGKSTFVNALIGKEILPTNDSPCTAVITEIQFKKGGDHSAKIYRKDGSVDSNCDFQAVIDIINGPTGAIGEVASYHHIVLELDTEQLTDKNYEQFVGKVKIVDCPGYGSKYYSNEEVIAEYMQSSNFTFWMSPCNKFGGSVAKTYLSEIKRKTQTLIPVITKADLIADKAEEDKIREDFNTELGDLFKMKEIVFVSALKWQESRKLQKSLDKNREKLSEDKINEYETKINNLYEESRVYNVMHQMMDSVGKKVINIAKITACKASLLEVLKDIKKVADDELRRWDKSLANAGIDIKSLDKKYSRINDVKEDVDKWIKDNVKDFSNALNTKIISELAKCDNPSQSEINRIFNTVLQDEQPIINDKLKDKLKKSYAKFLGERSVVVGNVEQLPPPGIPLDDLKRVLDPVKNVLFGVLDALKSAGVQSVLTGAAGGGLLVSLSAIEGIAFVGGALATVASIAGVALLGVAFVPLIPAFADRIKRFNKQSKEERAIELRNTIASGFKDKIQPGLEDRMLDVSENYYNSIISEIDKTNGKKEQNYKTVADVIIDVTQTIDSINKNF